MSDTATVKTGPVLGEVHEVRATFASPEAMQDAVSRLEMAGFDRADLSLPEAMPAQDQATPEAGAKPVDTEEDARQARTLHTSGAAAVAALAAGAAVIATGGAVAPAMAAAVIGGGAVGGAVFGLSSAANSGEQEDRELKAATGTLILSVRTPSEAKRQQAVAVLTSAGAASVEPHSA